MFGCLRDDGMAPDDVGASLFPRAEHGKLYLDGGEIGEQGEIDEVVMNGAPNPLMM